MNTLMFKADYNELPDNTKCKLNAYLLSIHSVSFQDEVNQALRLNVWLRLDWNNSFLTWDPAEYDNVTSIHIDNSKVWTPDIAMYNK